MLIIQNYEYVKVETLGEGLKKLCEFCMTYPSTNCYVAFSGEKLIALDLFRDVASFCQKNYNVEVNGTHRRIVFKESKSMTEGAGWHSKIIMMDGTRFPADPNYDRFRGLNYFSGMIVGPINDDVRLMLEDRSNRQSRHYNLPGYIYTL